MGKGRRSTLGKRAFSPELIKQVVATLKNMLPKAVLALTTADLVREVTGLCGEVRCTCLVLLSLFWEACPWLAGQVQLGKISQYVAVLDPSARLRLAERRRIPRLVLCRVELRLAVPRQRWVWQTVSIWPTWPSDPGSAN